MAIPAGWSGHSISNDAVITYPDSDKDMSCNVQVSYSALSVLPKAEDLRRDTIEMFHKTERDGGALTVLSCESVALGGASARRVVCSIRRKGAELKNVQLLVAAPNGRIVSVFGFSTSPDEATMNKRFLQVTHLVNSFRL